MMGALHVLVALTFALAALRPASGATILVQVSLIGFVNRRARPGHPMTLCCHRRLHGSSRRQKSRTICQTLVDFLAAHRIWALSFSL